jgi:hypothetical protein
MRIYDINKIFEIIGTSFCKGSHQVLIIRRLGGSKFLGRTHIEQVFGKATNRVTSF